MVLFFFLSATLPQRNCRNVRKGEYYFQPANSTKKFLVVRTGTFQKEVEINTRDTSYWKIKWIADCRFTLEFSHRTNKLTMQERSFYASRKIVVQILNVTRDYYSFKAGLDSISSRSLIDTLWMKR